MELSGLNLGGQDNSDLERLSINIVNVSPATNGHPRTSFEGPGRTMRPGENGPRMEAGGYPNIQIPLGTEKRPFVSVPNVAPLRIGKFLMQRYANAGLREWKSPTAAPETDHDKETLRLIQESAEIVAGTRPPPVITDAINRPWMGRGPQRDVKREDVLPTDKWGEAELESFVMRNRFDVPKTLPWKDRVARARHDAEVVLRRGDVIHPPVRPAVQPGA